MSKNLFAAGALALCLTAGGAAGAATMLETITFTDGTFADGGTFSGSETVNPATDTTATWDITTTSGTTRSGFEYTNANSMSESGAIFDAAVGGNQDVLTLSFIGPELGPGTLSGEEYSTNSPFATSPMNDARDITGGDYTVSFAVTGSPEPASWALMILGIGMTGAQFRRRRLAISATRPF
jgi:hypothetical protein